MKLPLHAGCVGIVLMVACGSTQPTPVHPRPAASGVWATDIEQVTQKIVEELRGVGLDVVIGQRQPPEPFSVGGQRIDIAGKPDEAIRVHVYATPEFAWNEASRLTPDGNVAPLPGQPPRSHVTWVPRQHFHYRDRMIVVYGGCNATYRDAMVKLFGPALVVADGIARCDLPR